MNTRKAKCAQCGENEMPSSRDLAFFQDHGPDSMPAKERCKCGFHKIAHDRQGEMNTAKIKCKQFEPHGPWEFDQYYCGCRGWD